MSVNMTKREAMDKIEKLLAVFDAASQDLRQSSRNLLTGSPTFFQNQVNIICGYIDLARQQLNYSVREVISENSYLRAKLAKTHAKLGKCREKKVLYKQKYKESKQRRARQTERSRAESRVNTSALNQSQEI